jgi:hypothetical protein
MALVLKLEENNLERPRVHEEVDCTYTAFSEAGRRYFQLDTYGSRTRELKGKKSQTIQLGEGAARALVELLKREFRLA